MNRSTGRSGIFDPEIALKTITWGRGATPKNRTLIEAYARRGEKVCSFQKCFFLPSVFAADGYQTAGRLWSTVCTVRDDPPLGRYLHGVRRRPVAERVPLDRARLCRPAFHPADPAEE